MNANDLIIQIRSDLQEKSQHWKNEELFVKLQRSFTSLQDDLPFFITKETLAITKEKDEYYLKHIPLKNVSCLVGRSKFNYTELENFYIKFVDKEYTFEEDKILLNRIVKEDVGLNIVYKYTKELKTLNCAIDIPLTYHKALRLLFLSDIHEKPTRNTKERNLSAYYLNLYEKEISKVKKNKKLRPKNVTSKYQRI